MIIFQNESIVLDDDDDNLSDVSISDADSNKECQDIHSFTEDASFDKFNIKFAFLNSEL